MLSDFFDSYPHSEGCLNRQIGVKPTTQLWKIKEWLPPTLTDLVIWIEICPQVKKKSTQRLPSFATISTHIQSSYAKVGLRVSKTC